METATGADLERAKLRRILEHINVEITARADGHGFQRTGLTESTVTNIPAGRDIDRAELAAEIKCMILDVAALLDFKLFHISELVKRIRSDHRIRIAVYDNFGGLRFVGIIRSAGNG